MNLRKHFLRLQCAILCVFCLVSATFSQNEKTPAQELARKIEAANSESERNELLEQNKELQTIDLRKALIAEGLRLRVQGDYDKARASDNFTWQFAERIGDQIGVASAINSIGVSYQEQGQNKIAIEYFNKSLERQLALKNQLGIATGFNNIGLGYSYLGDYARAEEYLQKALKILQEIDRKDLMPNPLNNLGIVQRRLGNLTQAQAYYEESLRLYTEAKNKLGASQALGNLANLKSFMGDYAAAVEFNNRSLALSEEVGNKKGTSITLANIGSSYLKEKNYPKALEYYERSLKIAEEIKAQTPLATALSNIANVKLKMNQPAEALELATRAAAVAREIGSEEVLWNSYKFKGEAYRQLKQPENVRQSFDAAIKIIESRRFGLSSAGAGTQNYFADKLQPYQEVIGLLVEQNDNAAALDYAEHAKARALLDILSSEPVEIANSMTGEEKTRENEINTKIGTLNRQILIERARQPQPDVARLKQLEADLEKARLDYEAFRSALYAAHPALQAKRGEAKIISPTEIAESLLNEPNKALLEYVVADEATYAFIITKAKSARAKSPIEIAVHKIPVSQTDLTAQTESFRQVVAAREDYEKPARALYDLLVAPVERELKGKTKIVVVPDGTLWNLPFQTLLTERNHFLLEDYVLSYAPSLTALSEMRKISRRHAGNALDKNMLLAFGNPVFNQPNTETKTNPALLRAGEALAPLPDAEREVQSLGDLYGAQHSEIYVGKEAREDRAKSEAKRFRVLQFATHGVFNDANPLYSYLILSPGAGNSEGSGDDGLLEARELMNLNLSADLVVLSACETARGRISSGEGLIGMTWALFVAGSPTTVASQWKVSSAGTTQIMLDFHRSLLGKNKQPDKAAALREAELALLRKGAFRHPFYWAGFVLIGND